eukprot:270604-Chlamydomonas_euryale.AAC.1
MDGVRVWGKVRWGCGWAAGGGEVEGQRRECCTATPRMHSAHLCHDVRVILLPLRQHRCAERRQVFVAQQRVLQRRCLWQKRVGTHASGHRKPWVVRAQQLRLEAAEGARRRRLADGGRERH